MKCGRGSGRECASRAFRPTIRPVFLAAQLLGVEDRDSSASTQTVQSPRTNHEYGWPQARSGGATVAAAQAGLAGAFFLEQFGQFFEHDAAQLLGVDDGDGATVVAGHVVADAACLYRLVRLKRTGRSIGTAFCKCFIVVAEMIGDADRAYLLDRVRHVGQTAEAERNLERVVIYPF
jgi:hypothetical protein